MKKNRFVKISAMLVMVFLLSFFGFRKTDASQFYLKSGSLYEVNKLVGEKKVSDLSGVNFLFDEKNSNFLISKEVSSVLEETEHSRVFNLTFLTQNGEERFISEKVKNAFFDKSFDRVFFVDENQDLFSYDLIKNEKKLLKNKIVNPSLNKNSEYIVYQKLNSDWQVGDYFDASIGIFVLNLKTGVEKQLTKKAEDFAPFFINSKNDVMFFSNSAEGLVSHFFVDFNGKNRKQLTNSGQKFVGNLTVAIPSEAPIVSDDGKYFVYESDNKIWINEFSLTKKQITKAKAIFDGNKPKWRENGKNLFVENEGKISSIDLNGIILK